MKKPVLILGAGGHAKVLVDALIQSGSEIVGIADADSSLVGTKLLGVPVLGGDEIINNFPQSEILLVNGLGSVRVTVKRKDFFNFYRTLGYDFATVIHPSAIIASDVVIGEGVQIMAGVVIQPGCQIGCNTIINTSSSVDHDCLIGENVHIAPGVTLSGGVRIGQESHVGTGATVIQGISIGTHSLVGAGAVVVRDVSDRTSVVGVPAKVIG